MFSVWKACLVGAVALTGFVSGNAQAADARIQGIGATFPAPLYAKWIEAFNKSHPGVVVDYQANGSGAGIKAITDRTAVFGASDAPLNDQQEKATPAKLLHIPTVAGPEAIIFNLPGVDKLNLNGDVLANIYLDNIHMWNDPRIAAINPGVKLPNTRVVVVHRADGSGTTYIFTDYLSKVSSDWKSKVGKGTTVNWKVGLGQSGNPAVANQIKTTPGAIGYVEWSYATSQKLPYTGMVNKDGKEVSASVAGVEAAGAALVKEFPDDFKVSITNAPGADSYPICGFTYLLVYEDLSYLKDKAVAQGLVDFIEWCETDGQDVAEAAGYAKLPKDAQAKVVERLKTIKFNGEALAK
jgi:phosphate transport system substrate-binding protein